MDLLFMLQKVPAVAYSEIHANNVELNLAKFIETIAVEKNLYEPLEALIKNVSWALAIWAQLLQLTPKSHLKTEPVSRILDLIYARYDEFELLREIPADSLNWQFIATAEFVAKLATPQETITHLQKTAAYSAQGDTMAVILNPANNIPVMLARGNDDWFFENFDLLCANLDATNSLWKRWDFCFRVLETRCTTIPAPVFFHIIKIHRKLFDTDVTGIYGHWWNAMREEIPRVPEMAARLMYVMPCEIVKPAESATTAKPTNTGAFPNAVRSKKIDFVTNLLAGPDDKTVSWEQWRKLQTKEITISFQQWLDILEYVKENPSETTMRKFVLLWMHTSRSASQNGYEGTAPTKMIRDKLSEITKLASQHYIDDFEWYPKLDQRYQSAIMRKFFNKSPVMEQLRALW